MDTPVIDANTLEIEVKKPKKRGRKQVKKDKVNFNITFEEKDVIIFFK
jgi:hypothetical protein